MKYASLCELIAGADRVWRETEESKRREAALAAQPESNCDPWAGTPTIILSDEPDAKEQDTKIKEPYDLLRVAVNLSESCYKNHVPSAELKNALDGLKSRLDPIEKAGSISGFNHLPVEVRKKDLELIMRSINYCLKNHKAPHITRDTVQKVDSEKGTAKSGVENAASYSKGSLLERFGYFCEGRIKGFISGFKRADAILLASVLAGIGIAYVAVNSRDPVLQETSTAPVIEQSPESSTSIGSMEYKGLSYTVPYHETIAFDSVKKYDPEIVVKKQECSACDGRSRANPHHIDVHNIESIIIKGKPLDKIPDMMTGLKKLKLLEISESQLADVSPLYSSFARNLKALETLKLNNNRLTSLESNLCELPSLKEVWIENNPIDWNDPDNKGALQRLEARGVKVYR
jgi:Leucine-rich repeat (LRR) protein